MDARDRIAGHRWAFSQRPTEIRYIMAPSWYFGRILQSPLPKMCAPPSICFPPNISQRIALGLLEQLYFCGELAENAWEIISPWSYRLFVWWKDTNPSSFALRHDTLTCNLCSTGWAWNFTWQCSFPWFSSLPILNSINIFSWGCCLNKSLAFESLAQVFFVDDLT